jgi:glycosyltransferase involved in cell wall biosynthesis
MLRPRLSRRWLWKAYTVARLSKRADNSIKRHTQASAILQVGTHVYTLRSDPPHYCFTDLTVAQAAAAGRFGFDQFTSDDLREAISVQKAIFDSCVRVFVPTEWARRSVVEEFQQDERKVIVTGEGAGIEPLSVDATKYSARTVLFVGYEWENKGGPLLVEALKIVRRQLPNVVLNVVGCRPKLELPGVKVFGVLRKDVPDEYEMLRRLYQGATCFCLLSELDAYGLVLIEAQLSGTPVVALDRGSRREVMVPGRSGLLVQDATPQAVADALLTILGSPQTAQRMGVCGREFVAGRYTWPAVARRILDHMALSNSEIPPCFARKP